jgi:hypothetical protein
MTKAWARFHTDTCLFTHRVPIIISCYITEAPFLPQLRGRVTNIPTVPVLTPYLCRLTSTSHNTCAASQAHPTIHVPPHKHIPQYLWNSVTGSLPSRAHSHVNHFIPWRTCRSSSSHISCTMAALAESLSPRSFPTSRGPVSGPGIVVLLTRKRSDALIIRFSQYGPLVVVGGRDTCVKTPGLLHQGDNRNSPEQVTAGVEGVVPQRLVRGYGAIVRP